MKTFFVLLVVSFLCGCASTMKAVFDPIKVKVPDVSIKKADMSTAILNVTLRVTNPNHVSATAKTLTYDIEIGGKTVSTGVFKKDVEIPADKTIETVVPIKVTNKDLVVFLYDVIVKNETSYRARGSVEVGPLSIPFDERGKITRKDL